MDNADLRSASTGEGQRPLPTGLRLLGMSRFLILIGITSIFVGSLTLLLFGAIETYGMVAALIIQQGPALAPEQLMLKAIKLTDFFLLATVLYIAAVALFELFMDRRLPLPEWLHISDVDGLKHKLIVVVITVLAVEFLGQVVSWRGDQNVFALGGAVAAMIAALSYFLSVRSAKGPSQYDDR